MSLSATELDEDKFVDLLGADSYCSTRALHFSMHMARQLLSSTAALPSSNRLRTILRNVFRKTYWREQVPAEQPTRAGASGRQVRYSSRKVSITPPSASRIWPIPNPYR